MMGWNQYGFSDPVTLNASRLVCYHDLVLAVVIFVLILVGWFTFWVISRSELVKGQLDLVFKKNEGLEFTWTVSPALLLFSIGFVSLVNLYYMNLGGEPVFSVSAVGHQWYWEYVYEVDSSCSFLEKTNSTQKSVPLSEVLFEIYKEWKKLGEAITNIGPTEYPLDMVLFLQEKMNVKMSSVVSILEMSKILEKSMDNFLMKLETAFSISKNCDSSFSQWKALLAVDSLMKEGDSMIEDVLNNVVFPREKDVQAEFESNKMFITNQLSLLSKTWGKILSSLFDDSSCRSYRLRYDSYMVSEEDLTSFDSSQFGGFRRGEVNNPCFLCYGVKNEVLVSTVDVMHSWGVPELGVKVDAVPGRVNFGSVMPLVSGFFYGFCYELCGSGHSEMPINVVVLEPKEFSEALELMKLKGSNLVAEGNFE